MSLRANANQKTVVSTQPRSFTLDVSNPGLQTNTALEHATDLKWSDLTETEKSAASLGVDPVAWKPITFMNTAHYDTLLKTNAIDADLAKKLEAFKHVSAGGS